MSNLNYNFKCIYTLFSFLTSNSHLLTVSSMECTAVVCVWMSVASKCFLWQNCITSSTSELDSAHFQALNRLLQELLTLWFAVGFLELQRVTWTSPCDIVQKVSHFHDWKERVASKSTCFLFLYFQTTI